MESWKLIVGGAHLVAILGVIPLLWRLTFKHCLAAAVASGAIFWLISNLSQIVYFDSIWVMYWTGLPFLAWDIFYRLPYAMAIYAAGRWYANRNTLTIRH